VAAGADAVKFQTFKADKVISPAAPKAAYQRATTGEYGSQLDIARGLELSYDDFRGLHRYCCERGIMFLSTPFDDDSVDFLAELVPAFKVPSGEITNLLLLEHVARHRRPVILSTGMADLGEVRVAVETLKGAGVRDVVLLHCVSNYPASAGSVNLRAMETMRSEFEVPVGFSDHTEGIAVALAAVALGACVIEKHFTLDRNLPGPDHRASLEPDALKAMMRGIREVESALGDGRKVPAPEELDTANVARRSLVAACAIPAGTTLSDKHVAILRPGTGLPPAMRERMLGRRVRQDIPAGSLLSLEMFE
jgi:N-acetylneuraminate synthase/N,N'-diacetyllegionaminate synthase